MTLGVGPRSSLCRGRGAGGEWSVGVAGGWAGRGRAAGGQRRPPSDDDGGAGGAGRVVAPAAAAVGRGSGVPTAATPRRPTRRPVGWWRPPRAATQMLTRERRCVDALRGRACGRAPPRRPGSAVHVLAGVALFLGRSLRPLCSFLPAPLLPLPPGAPPPLSRGRPPPHGAVRQLQGLQRVAHVCFPRRPGAGAGASVLVAARRGIPPAAATRPYVSPGVGGGGRAPADAAGSVDAPPPPPLLCHPCAHPAQPTDHPRCRLCSALSPPHHALTRPRPLALVVLHPPCRSTPPTCPQCAGRRPTHVRGAEGGEGGRGGTSLRRLLLALNRFSSSCRRPPRTRPLPPPPPSRGCRPRPRRVAPPPTDRPRRW